PFNIKADSIRLGNFTADEVRELYLQHTADTGQVFQDDAMTNAWTLTEGQPWLVNALAREVIEKMKVPVHEAITVDHIENAKDRLILARATHIDSLLARLREEPVRRILEPVIAGEMPQHDPLDDDQRYVMDLGLIAAEPTVRIANPIYREVILRVLASAAEPWVLEDPRRYVAPNGMLDVKRLFEGFAEFWKQHGELLAPRMAYSEAAAQLVLVGFLHKIVNGGGLIEREIGVGKKRIDMMVQWPYTDENGKKQAQRMVVEIKVWRDRDKKGDPLVQGLKQIDEYLARLGLNEGTLVIFDSRSIAEPIDDRTRFESQVTSSGRAVMLLRA
ncbi:MAG TPA: ATP-binding protein, partial [Polyangium sp.]|nr:ATP-binding protein [Polyangium sp.]